ncbi:RHS repeat-associated core domain-containing protein [Paenibacillus sp. FSL K6-1217]|uniref:RHS repeat-associated core domain-containing protein n=1 Tax=Paenibacillus sp. FSL K6-1217 TaxID=2921466 RepID=UPI00325585A0
MKKNSLIRKILLVILCLAIVYPNLTIKAEGKNELKGSNVILSSTKNAALTLKPSPSSQPQLEPSTTFSPEHRDNSSVSSKTLKATESAPPVFTSAAEDVYSTGIKDTISILKSLSLKKQGTASFSPFSAKASGLFSTEISKREIEKLALSGASIEDIYWVNLLLQDFPSKTASDLWELKKGKDSWQQIWDDIKGESTENNKSVDDSVYSDVRSTALFENNTTVSKRVYSDLQFSEDKSLMQISSLDANVNSVFSGLITQQQINQTGKQQYSDHSGNSELIDPASGALTWKETDISLPGRDGLDLNVGVMYNSNQSFAYMRNYESSGWIKKYNYLNSRYDLGIGWSLQFPSVQLADGYKYYHDGQGAIYQIDLDSYYGQQSYSHLVGYQGKKIRFMKDESGTFTNGQTSSSYYLEYLDKKREYFDSDGLLLGIIDNFGNKIVFQYVERAVYDGANHKVISLITDSIGRTVNFNYENNLNTTGSFPGEKIIVTVNTNSVESQRVVYTKTRSSLTFNGNPDGYAPVLWKTTDQVGQDTLFDYDSSTPGKFNYVTKISDANAGYNSYNRLTKVSYPSSYTKYSYDLVNRNLGSSGIGQEYRVTSRQDVLSNKYNEIKYSYSGDYMGDTDPYNPKPFDASYTFSSTSTVQSTTSTNELTTITTFNGIQQLLSTATQAANRERKVVTNIAFDPVLTHYPTQTRTSEYGVSDSDDTANQTYTETSYTEWGEVKSQTQSLLPSQFNDSNIKRYYTTNFTYEPTFHFLESKSWYQNEGDSSPATERYEYNSTGRISNFINAINEETRYTYSYAVGTNSIEQMMMEKLVRINSDPLRKYKTVSKTVLNYGQEVKYAFPTEQQQWINIGQSNQQIIKSKLGYDFGTGKLISQSDEKGSTTQYKYDKAGRLIKVQNPNYTNISGEAYSEVEDLSYEYVVPGLDNTNYGMKTLNVRSTKTLTKNADGSAMKTYESSYYNGLGLMLLQENWDEYQGKWVQTQYHYDDLMRPIYMIDAVGNTITASYDAWGKQNLSTDAYGKRYETIYNLKSRNSVSYMQSASSSTEKFNYLSQNYDYKGNIISIMTYKDWPSQSNPIKESYRYDIQGNIVAYTDPNNNLNADGVTTSYSYDPLNRLISIKDALNQTTFYTYDGNGKVTNVTIKAGNGLTENVSDKIYNELGVIKEKIDGSSSQSERIEYSNLGLPKVKVDRKGTIFNYNYDERNRLTSELISGQQNESEETKYIFSDGRTNQNTILHYTNGIQTAFQNEIVDSMGRKRGYYTVAGEHSAYILNQKDATGRLTQINDYFLNFYTNYQYDKQRISKIQTNGNQAINSSSSANVVYNYFPNGLVQSIIFPTLTDNTTLKTEYTYNKALNWVESLTNKKGDQILSEFQYTYDNNGNVISITETKSDGTKQTSNYSYDALNRLSASNRNGSSNKVIYTYDLKGNRKTLEANDEIEKEYTDSSHVYNLQNVLTSVTKGTSKTDYYYYADGLRYKKVNGNNETQYNYNFNTEVITEEKNNGEQANYVRGDRVLVKKEKKDNNYLKDYYYLYNGHGDVIQIVDTSGTIVNSYSYDEWGNISNQFERISNPFKYTGEIYDEETGYYYLRARYYDPSIGRFLNEDTYEGQIDNPLSMNFYTYVENNPLNFTDPSGHYKKSDDPALRALVKPFEDNYNKAKASGDKNGMVEAEKAADAVRVSYYVCDANSFCGSRANLPSDIKYRYDTYDMYLEGKYGNAHEVSIFEDPIAFVVFTVATDGIYAFSRGGPMVAQAGQKFYHVTSKEAASDIIKSGLLSGSKQEAGQVFVWTTKPTLAQARNSGARSLETVVEFEIPAGALSIDRTVAENLQRFARATRGPLKVINVKEVPFK